MKKNEGKMQFKIEWCEICKTNMVICPKCGNNSCNAGYGEINGKCCDVCPLAYQYQDLYWQMEKSCICPKECICEYGHDKKLELLPKLIKTSKDCPVHNKLESDPKCPIHGKKIE